MFKFMSKYGDKIHVIFLVMVIFVLDLTVLYGFSGEYYRSNRFAMLMALIFVSFNSILTYRAVPELVFLWKNARVHD